MHTFKTFAAVIMILSGALFGSQAKAAWLGPTSAPPNNNIDAPLNVGTIFNGDVKGQYGNLKLDIVNLADCSSTQVLIWDSGRIKCGMVNGGPPSGDTTNNYYGGGGGGPGSLAATLAIGSNAISFTADTIFGGNIGIGTEAPNSQLHIYDTGKNAEIDLQSLSGANNQWAIYNDKTTNDFRIWNNNPVDDGYGAVGARKNVLAITSSGQLTVGGLIGERSSKLKVSGSLLTPTTPGNKVLIIDFLAPVVPFDGNGGGNAYWAAFQTQKVMAAGYPTYADNDWRYAESRLQFGMDSYPQGYISNRSVDGDWRQSMIFGHETYTGKDIMAVSAYGNVGIGVIQPVNRLEVNGGITIDSSDPTNKTNTLYNDNGALYWNGSQIGQSGSGSVSSSIPAYMNYAGNNGVLKLNNSWLVGNANSYWSAGLETVNIFGSNLSIPVLRGQVVSPNGSVFQKFGAIANGLTVLGDEDISNLTFDMIKISDGSAKKASLYFNTDSNTAGLSGADQYAFDNNVILSKDLLLMGGTNGSNASKLNFGGGGEYIYSVRDVNSSQKWSLNFATNDTNRLTIANNGNIGIGTANPGYRLEVNGDGNFAGTINSLFSGSTAVPNIANSGGFRITVDSMESLDLNASRIRVGGLYLNAATEAVKLTESGGSANLSAKGNVILQPTGNVGIHTDTPAAALDVVVSSGPVANLGGSASGNRAIAGIGGVGNGAQAKGDYSLALGASAIADGDYSVALGGGAGNGTNATGDGALAAGLNANANGYSAVALGSGTAIGLDSFAANDATANGSSAIALGNGQAIGDGSLAAGRNATANGTGAVAIGGAFGSGTVAIGEGALAAGGNCYANGYSAVAIGNVIVNGDRAIGIGNGGATVSGNDSFVLAPANGIVTVNGVVQADSFQSGSHPGLTKVVNLTGSNGSACTMTFTGGIMTATTCP